MNPIRNAVTEYIETRHVAGNQKRGDELGQLEPRIPVSQIGHWDIYPKSCTSRYCVKLTSSGKCGIIGIAKRRQTWQSDTQQSSSSRWSPSC
jgi:hypothetical protein